MEGPTYLEYDTVYQGAVLVSQRLDAWAAVCVFWHTIGFKEIAHSREAQLIKSTEIGLLKGYIVHGESRFA